VIHPDDHSRTAGLAAHAEAGQADDEDGDDGAAGELMPVG